MKIMNKFNHLISTGKMLVRLQYMTNNSSLPIAITILTRVGLSLGV